MAGAQGVLANEFDINDMIIKRNYILRFFSAAIIFVLFATSIFYVRCLFNLLIASIALLMMLEWYKMGKGERCVLAIGPVIILPAIFSLYHLSSIDHSGWLLFTFFCTIWTVDTMAMICGKAIGGAKLSPSISPRKTISGLIGGVLCGACVFYALLTWQVVSIAAHPDYSLMLFALILALSAQGGDLLESLFKRKCHIKDSGNLIPGHGGVLDRFDSIILAAPLLALYVENMLI